MVRSDVEYGTERGERRSRWREEPLAGLAGSGAAASWEGLERAHALLAAGETRPGMQALFSMLRHTRAILDDEDWARFCRETCRVHPVHRLVQRDLATQWCFMKPRKYAGDAVLLDFFYQDLDLDELGSSSMGIDILRFLGEQQTVTALRGRRDTLAQWIDAHAERVSDPRLLSVACGHLREAHLSRAVRERRVGEFLAFDQDQRSLLVVDKELGSYGIRGVPGSVRALLKGQQAFSGLDFIYAAGLYDYLPQPIAIQLTRILFSMLKSGGYLLLANYADPPQDSGFKAYMEAFMDWWLIYREESDVEEWLRDIPKLQLSRHRVFRDPTCNLIYVEAVHV
jgi:extracellular factor (EF) 3-hydroxypalmitic acid methyl ester biosynthesis protein